MNADCELTAFLVQRKRLRNNGAGIDGRGNLVRCPGPDLTGHSIAVFLKNPQSGKAVIAVSSHVARGSVGNRGAVFALETLGIPVWSVPTVILPYHPGHGPSTRIVPPPHSFTAFLRDLENAPWLGEVGAIMSGYLGDAVQADAISALVSAVRSRNPEALYLCDPVIGDKDNLYIPEKTARAIRDVLIPLADIATPNRFELGWLTGNKCADHEAIIAAAGFLPPGKVLVTSTPSGENIGNLLVTDENVFEAFHPVLPKPPNGLGDLTSALFLGYKLMGRDDRVALKRTTESVFDLLVQTKKRGADELTLAADSKSLMRTGERVATRRRRRP